MGGGLNAGEYTWTLAASVLVVPHMLIVPQYPNPCGSPAPRRRALGAHTFSLRSRHVTVWQVRSRHNQHRLCHHIRAGTTAQGASITSTTTRPCP